MFTPIAEILKPLTLDIIEPLQVKGKPLSGDFEKLDTMAEEIYQKHKPVALFKQCYGFIN